MKNLTLNKKIEELNRLCDNSISITRYNDYWEIHSYKDNTILNMEYLYPHISAKNFKDLINIAYEYVKNNELESAENI